MWKCVNDEDRAIDKVNLTHKDGIIIYIDLKELIEAKKKKEEEVMW